MIPVAFDLRDPLRSGIARVAASTTGAFLEEFGSEFRVTVVGPEKALTAMGIREWGAGLRTVPWEVARYSVAADVQWQRVRTEVGDAIWYFPHWDVPWRAMGERFVVTLHDIGHLRLAELSPLKRVVARRWIGRTLARAQRVLTVSRFTSREVLAVWPGLATKLTVVPNGVDERFYRTPPPLPSLIASRVGAAPFMLSVGIRKKRKNLEVGVDVLSLLPDLHWVVVGDWFREWEAVAARSRRAGVADRIIVLDRQDDETLHALYRSAACLLFPSRYEGFGLPILEALASGTPVVAATGTSSEETLGNAGWLCDPDDGAQFARAVREILDLGERRREVAEHGRARAREFTWQRTAEGLADAFRDIARR